MPLLYHAYVYLEFLILACTIYILAPRDVTVKLNVQNNSEIFKSISYRYKFLVGARDPLIRFSF